MVGMNYDGNWSLKLHFFVKPEINHILVLEALFWHFIQFEELCWLDSGKGLVGDKHLGIVSGFVQLVSLEVHMYRNVYKFPRVHFEEGCYKNSS